MDEEENFAEEGDSYDLMLRLEQLESLREDMEEAGFDTLAKVEAALALTVPGNNPEAEEKRALLSTIRSDLLEVGLSDLAGVEAEIDRLNGELDAEDDF